MRISDSEKTVILFALQERVTRLRKAMKTNPNMSAEMRETKDLLEKLMVFFVNGKIEN